MNSYYYVVYYKLPEDRKWGKIIPLRLETACSEIKSMLQCTPTLRIKIAPKCFRQKRLTSGNICCSPE